MCSATATSAPSASEWTTTMNRILTAAALAIALGAPVAAHADQPQDNEDCRNLAGYVAVQNYDLSHAEPTGVAGRNIIAIVQGMRAEHRDASAVDILARCGFKGPQRIWSLAKSGAAEARVHATEPRGMTCDPDGFGGMDCDED
jgi:hypothetical protein